MTTKAAELAQAHWNKTPLYLPEGKRYLLYPWLYEAAEFCNHAGEKVLEVGCGTGSDLLQFAKHGATATGIDITEQHLKLAEERVGTSAAVVRGNATSIPFPNESFDYVYSHGVLHHIDEPARVVSEILRVLRPGGRFNIHVYAKWSYFTAYLILRRGKHWRDYVENSTDPVHIELYSRRKLESLFPVPIKVRKYHVGSCQALGPLAGWFLVATGIKR